MADATLHYRTADGTLAARAVTGAHAEAPELPEGATPLTEQEYAAALATVQAQREEHAEEITTAAQQAQQTDYEALRALNVPDATARRLTGYDGPAASEEN